MEKTRVPKGEKYYFINICFEVMSDYECGADVDDLRFDTNNYFTTEEEAEPTACKLRAVFKGADVLERWESEEVLNTLRVALSAEYGLTGLDSQREIDEKIAKTPETCLMRMLKKSIEIMSKIVK